MSVSWEKGGWWYARTIVDQANKRRNHSSINSIELNANIIEKNLERSRGASQAQISWFK